MMYNLKTYAMCTLYMYILFTKQLKTVVKVKMKGVVLVEIFLISYTVHEETKAVYDI